MRLTAAVCVLVSATFAWCADGEKTPAGPVLLLPDATSPCRLRLDVTVDGKPPTAAWEDFLDRLLDFFDRDGDGCLSRAEADRMFLLPLPGRNKLTIDFARLDANGDGKASRAELKAYCLANGFTPVVTVLEPVSEVD